MNSKTNQEELTMRNRKSVQSTSVQRTSVQYILCAQRAHSHWHRVLFFGYYSRFYLFTFAPAEIGEFVHAFENMRSAKNFNFSPPHRSQICPHGSIPRRKRFARKKTRKTIMTGKRLRQEYDYYRKIKERFRTGCSSGKHLSFISQPATILRRRSLSARRCSARTLALTFAFAI